MLYIAKPIIAIMAMSRTAPDASSLRLGRDKPDQNPGLPTNRVTKPAVRYP
jgi:hypothetical protein